MFDDGYILNLSTTDIRSSSHSHVHSIYNECVQLYKLYNSSIIRQIMLRKKYIPRKVKLVDDRSDDEYRSSDDESLSVDTTIESMTIQIEEDKLVRRKLMKIRWECRSYLGINRPTNGRL